MSIASAAILPNFSAVPLGASSLKRWWHSMISTSTPVGKSRSAFAAISVSFIATLTAVLMLGDHTIGIFFAASAMYACCSLSRPVVAMTTGRRIRRNAR